MEISSLADVLIATWRVSQADRPLPQGQGLLDQALKSAIDRGAFPGQFKDLTFLNTPLGIYCPDLLGVLDYANMSLLITTPNPTYKEAQINLSREAAEAILEEQGIRLEDAKEWGTVLGQVLDDLARGAS
jgi:hypothetical protein